MANSIHVRFASELDLDFIYTSLIELVTEAKLVERFSQTRASLEAALFSNTPSAEVLIAELDHIPAAIALFSMTDRNFTLFNGPGLYLHDLYVKEEYRRKGLATALIKHLEQIAKDRACSRIDWVVLTNNDLGKEFYRSITKASPVNYIQYMRIRCEEFAS